VVEPPLELGGAWGFLMYSFLKNCKYLWINAMKWCFNALFVRRLAVQFKIGSINTASANQSQIGNAFSLSFHPVNIINLQSPFNFLKAINLAPRKNMVWSCRVFITNGSSLHLSETEKELLQRHPTKIKRLNATSIRDRKWAHTATSNEDQRMRMLYCSPLLALAEYCKGI
jgi:hypothetical protein